MFKKTAEFYKKHREVLSYVFFGGLTTLVNLAVYGLLMGIPDGIPLLGGYEPLLTGKSANAVSTVAAWALSVLFAYLTNRKWVFRSTATGSSAIFLECALFFAARALSGALDLGIMFLFVDIFGLHRQRLLIKATSNIIVIIINYVVSKLWIFRKSDPAGE